MEIRITDKLIIVVSFILLGSLALLRSYHSILTGFILPDETIYYYLVYRQISFGIREIYAGRELFQKLLFLITFQLGLDTPEKFMTVMPFVISLFGVGCVAISLKILKLLDFSQVDRTRIFLFIFPFLITFSLLSVAVIPETVALFFGFLGVYYMVHFAKKKDSNSIILGAISFGFATLFREPYLVFLGGNIVLLLYMRLRRRVKVRQIFPFVCIVSLMFFFVLSARGLSFVSYVTPKTGNWGGIPVGNIIKPQPPPYVPPLYEPYTEVSPAQSVFSTFSNIFLGFLFGWSPFVTILFLVSFPFFIKDKGTHILIKANFCFGIVAYFVTLYFARTPLSWATLVFISALMRYANVAIPSLLIISVLWHKNWWKKVQKYFLVISIVLILFLTPLYPHLILSQMENSSNRFNFRYRSPVLKLRDYVSDKGNVLVTIPVIEKYAGTSCSSGTFIQTVLYIRLENVSIQGLPYEPEDFFELVNGTWDNVYIFAIKSIGQSYTEERYLWYLDMRSNSSNLIVIFDYDEAYLLRWAK